MRKEVTIVISADGRDKGKAFHLREMPASQGERFALKVFHALAKSGFSLPDDLVSSGMAGIARVGLGILSSLEFGDLMALMEEMFACVQVVPDPNRPQVMRKLIEEDIEEVSTRLKLRKELLALHIDFFAAAARSTSPSADQAAQQGA